VPGSEHPRTTTYELTAGDPAKIDLQTRCNRYAATYLWEPPVDPTPAVTGFALTAAKNGEAEIAAHRRSLSSVQPSWPTRDVTELTLPQPQVLDVVTLKTQGLIRVDGDRMTYIVSNPGGPRPASFETTPGDGLTKVVLRRLGSREP
jgi:hypothetical protein